MVRFTRRAERPGADAIQAPCGVGIGGEARIVIGANSILGGSTPPAGRIDGECGLTTDILVIRGAALQFISDWSTVTTNASGIRL